MKLTDFTCIALLAFALLTEHSPAQAIHPDYDPVKTFAPLTLPQAVDRYRSSNGAPGPDYWQNAADYEIHAVLDPQSKRLEASEIITYTNNSPDALPSLWIQIEQNTYRRDARSSAVGNPPPTEFTDGYTFESVEVEEKSRVVKADFLISDTRMQIRLPQPLSVRGGRVRIHIRYHYTIPGVFGGRTSWGKAKDGEIYDIAQWYPRMAVYDDLRGWDTLPFISSEFYLEYGSFDYYVTVPADMLVAGSGELENPQEVLTAAQIRRLEQARAGDRTVMIRSAAEIHDPASRPKTSGTLTWHFRIENARDAVFSASSAFVWDAARIQLPGGGSGLAMSFYPEESGGPEAWGRSTEYLKHAVEEFSARWFPYPYINAINVAGFTDGMEYPGILFDGIDSKGKELFWVTAHEIGHTWFPMIVGSNERRDAWMDEGFNTFIDIFESDDFEGGVYGPKRDSEYSDGGEPADTILKVLDDPAAPPIFMPADAIADKYMHPVSYFKAAFGLVLLRQQILGPERFDAAFRKYIRDWAYRHPAPSDFFREMESEGGEDLGWFWRGWFMNNWTFDLSVDNVSYPNGNAAQGATIKIVNHDQLVLPAVIEIEFQDGSRKRVHVPVETWMTTGVYNLKLDSKQPIRTVTIDPDHLLPDDNRRNNVFQAANH